LAHARLRFGGKFYFLSLLVKQLGPWIGCVFCGDHEVHRANNALKQLRFAFCLVSFFTTAADLLQVTIAFVLEIFSFSDREKVLGDGFDRHCWAAAYMCQTGDTRAQYGPPRLFIWPTKFKELLLARLHKNNSCKVSRLIARDRNPSRPRLEKRVSTPRLHHCSLLWPTLRTCSGHAGMTATAASFLVCTRDHNF